MSADLRVLLIEDCENDAELVVHTLTAGGYRVFAERLETAQSLIAALERQDWDLAISDHTMPQFSGTAALTLVRERAPDLPFIFVSGTIGEDAAVEAMKNGAHDYLLKGHLKRLVPAVGRELRDAAVRRDRKRANERLAHFAYHDALTDLPNRLLLYDRLQQAVLLARRDREPLTLLIMDLNRFKAINDTCGHHAGDCVLQEVAARLRAALRASDTVARLSGDEFAIVLPFTDAEGARLAARKVLSDLRRPMIVDGQTLSIRASIGISQYEQGSTAESLLRGADLAMYVAKTDGTEVAVYTPDRGARAHRRPALPNDLRPSFESHELCFDRAIDDRCETQPRAVGRR